MLDSNMKYDYYVKEFKSCNISIIATQIVACARRKLKIYQILENAPKIYQILENEIYQILQMVFAVGRDRIVVSTLRCGRNNPGSNPGHGKSGFPSQNIFWQKI